MTQKILELCRAMGAGDSQEALLHALAEASVRLLRQRLRPGITPEDCGAAFPLAAAMLAMEGLEQSDGSGQVEAFTAGNVSIRRAAGRKQDGFRVQAERLMGPWLTEQGFAFRGVDG